MLCLVTRLPGYKVAWLQLQGCLATKGRQGFVEMANTKQKAQLKSKKVLANGEGGKEVAV